ncbi:hypothetical protein HK103_005391 [Boothiomyces macroporosus]|uniref:GLTSCR protein conserved domain-containing protein n=1 Tax=Boothiomyces macroporosus TaxID=261099 RepID=A0AAD5ULY8_9FUNG|nr:hypothetical protein HK103_005391 [Boothiomyces macroporosus]
MSGRGNPNPNRPTKPLSAADFLSNPALLSAYIAAYSSLSNARPPKPPQMAASTYDQILAKTLAAYSAKPRPVNTPQINRPIVTEKRSPEEQEHSRVVKQRIEEALTADHEKVLNPSTEPFVNKEDMISRLLAFHVVQIPSQEKEQVKQDYKELVDGAISRINLIEQLEQAEAKDQSELLVKFAEFLTTMNKQ